MNKNLIPVPTEPGVLERRKTNQEVVEQYLLIKGNSVEERMALFHQEIMYEIVNTKECRPERTCGWKKVKRRFEDNSANWEDFEYCRIKLWPADDPDVFLVECDGRGKMISPMFSTPRPYENYYFIMFVMRDGKIWQLRQFTNPMKLVHDFWKDMPDFCK